MSGLSFICFVGGQSTKPAPQHQRWREIALLGELQQLVKKKEQKKGQRHKVFEESFDAKECYSHEFLFQKLDYIHHNPVSKRWNLVNDFRDYKYSSASFYEQGIKRYDRLIHVNDVLQ